MDRKWRTDAARLHEVLDRLGVADSTAGLRRPETLVPG
ncbi:hypothetical protein SNARM312S_01002 [Streptomyces narbonensis]